MNLTPAEASGAYWDKRSSQKEAETRRWFNSEIILRHCNQKICGNPLPVRGMGLLVRLKELTKEAPLKKGVSIGCGAARTEIELLAQGVVSSFVLYEASKVRIDQAHEYATKRGLVDRIEFNHVQDFSLPEVKGVDFVFWKAALHHMLDTEAAVEWSLNTLSDGGMFVIDEYVGPNRFQWTETSLEASDRIRAALPERYFYNAQMPQRPHSRLTPRVNRESLIKRDPTEAADSENIIPAIKKCFPDAEIITTGGAAYHLALRGIMNNFTPEDDPVVNLVLLVDDLLERAGEYHFATVIARKKASG